MGEPSTKEPRLDEDVAGKTNPEREPVPDSKAEQSPGTMRKKHRLLGDRICRVCGDKAVAHNFDVITCESCKTFFRRNARKTQARVGPSSSSSFYFSCLCVDTSVCVCAVSYTHLRAHET